MLSVKKLEDMYKDLLLDTSTFSYATGCNVGIDDTCLPNEECIANYPKSRAGTCRCKEGFERNFEGECVAVEMRGKLPKVIYLLFEKLILLIYKN